MLSSRAGFFRILPRKEGDTHNINHGGGWGVGGGHRGLLWGVVFFPFPEKKLLASLPPISQRKKRRSSFRGGHSSICVLISLLIKKRSIASGEGVSIASGGRVLFFFFFGEKEGEEGKSVGGHGFLT